MSKNLGPNVDPDDMPHPYEYDDRPYQYPYDSGNPDPWEEFDPKPAPQVEKDPQGKCSAPGCLTTFRNRHQWDRSKAAKEGWFFQRDEVTFWCPEHHPVWVAEWRAKQAAKKARKRT